MTDRTCNQAYFVTCPIMSGHGSTVFCKADRCMFWVETIPPQAEYAPPGGGQTVFRSKDSSAPTFTGKDMKQVTMEKVDEHPAKGKCMKVIEAKAIEDAAFALQGIHTILMNRG